MEILKCLVLAGNYLQKRYAGIATLIRQHGRGMEPGYHATGSQHPCRSGHCNRRSFLVLVVQIRRHSYSLVLRAFVRALIIQNLITHKAFDCAILTIRQTLTFPILLPDFLSSI